MGKLKLEAWRKALEARPLQERAIILAVAAALLGYLWLLFASDPLAARRADLSRQLSLAQAQILEQEARQRELQASYSQDPDAIARERLGRLQAETRDVDARLNELYGQLIAPREMSYILTSILRKETALRLVSLENLAPEALFESALGALPLVGPAPEQVAASADGLTVYKHGLRMTFEGSYLETLRFLRSLEELDSNFFWEDLSLQAGEYPQARIVFSIFTLSTREEWIGV